MKALALRVAVLDALADRVREHLTTAREELLRAMVDAGDERKRAELPSGEQVATITRASRKGGAKAVVMDPPALLAWVRQNRPGEIVEQIRPSFVTALLAADGVDVVNGELIPGIEVVEVAPGAPYLSVRPAGDRDALLAEAWRSGVLSGLVGDVLVPAEIDGAA